MSRDHRTYAAFLAALELTASEREDLLPWLLDTFLNSPVRWAVLELGRRWRARADADDLADLAMKAARDLDRLERARSWRHPRQIVDEPHVAALYDFTRKRRDRVAGLSRSRRLDVMRHKLKRAHDDHRQRQMLVDFLNEPAPPVDPTWLQDFLRAKDETAL